MAIREVGRREAVINKKTVMAGVRVQFTCQNMAATSSTGSFRMAITDRCLKIRQLTRYRNIAASSVEISQLQ